jgi:hypothetical protein
MLDDMLDSMLSLGPRGAKCLVSVRPVGQETRQHFDGARDLLRQSTTISRLG